MARPPREGFIARVELKDIEVYLAKKATEPEGTLLALVGSGGFGKTTLAQAACQLKRVRQRYPDGILWATMGENSDVSTRLARVRDMIRFLTEEEPLAYESADTAAVCLRDLLAGKHALVVVDDVWKFEDVEAFLSIGASARLMITTRDRRSLPPKAKIIEIGPMTEDEAEALLARDILEYTQVELISLAAKLGRWPLLLSLVNRQLQELLREGCSIENAREDVEEAFQSEGLTAFDLDSRDAESRDLAVERTLDASLNRLSDTERSCYVQLAIFSEDHPIPLCVLERLWGRGAHQVRKLCARLYSLSLLNRFDRVKGGVGLHDVIRSYLLKKYVHEIPIFHKTLLEAYLPESGHWADLPASEKYIWSKFSYHMLGAGLKTQLRELLYDFRFLQAKLEATFIWDMISDFMNFPEDDEVRIICNVLQESERDFYDKSQFAPQLLGRLLDREEPNIRRMLEGAQNWRGGIWFRPKYKSMGGPHGKHGARHRIPNISPASMKFVDERRLLCGGFDGNLYLWDVEGGEVIATLKGKYADPVTAVLLVDEKTVVSGTYYGSLQVWSLEEGQLCGTFGGAGCWVKLVHCISDNLIASQSFEGVTCVWDIRDGAIIYKIKEVPTWSAVAINRTAILAAGLDKMFRVYDLSSGKMIFSLDSGHTSSALVLLEDSCIVSTSFEGTILAWDLKKRSLVHKFGRSYSIDALASFGSQYVITGSTGGVELWHVEGEKLLSTISLHGEIKAIAACQTSGLVVAAGFGGQMHAFDLLGL